MSDNLLNQCKAVIHREPGEPSWVCTDCIQILANGQWPEYMTEQELADFTVAFTATCINAGDPEITVGMLYKYHECGKEVDSDNPDNPAIDRECECEHSDFSCRTCATCGTTLAGSRDAVTFWTETEDSDNE